MMVNPQRQAAGRKGGTESSRRLPRCPNCGRKMRASLLTEEEAQLVIGAIPLQALPEDTRTRSPVWDEAIAIAKQHRYWGGFLNDQIVAALEAARSASTPATRAHVEGCTKALSVPVDLCECGGRVITWPTPAVGADEKIVAIQGRQELRRLNCKVFNGSTEALEDIDYLLAALAPSPAVAQACVKCPHRGKVSAEGFCQHPATICGCKCEFAAVAHPDINNPNARYCEVCTYKIGKATWHLPPLCAATTQRPAECPWPDCGCGGATAVQPADLGAVTRACPLAVVENPEGTWDILINDKEIWPRATQWTKGGAEELVRLIHEAYVGAVTPEQDAVVDEVQRRMDAVVDAAVEWHQSGREGDSTWFDKAEMLGKAIDSLLELRDPSTPEQDQGEGGESTVAAHSDWQPIETAPKDGTDILVCTDDKAIVCAWWSDDFGEWRTYGVGGNQWIEPTHWMPLPAPPSSSTQATGGPQTQHVPDHSPASLPDESSSPTPTEPIDTANNSSGVVLSIDQCIAQFRRYATGNPSPDRAFTLNFCADFLRDFAERVPVATPTESEPQADAIECPACGGNHRWSDKHGAPPEPSPTESEEEVARAAAKKIWKRIDSEKYLTLPNVSEIAAIIAPALHTHSAALTAKIYDECIAIAKSKTWFGDKENPEYILGVVEALETAKARAAKEKD